MEIILAGDTGGVLSGTLEAFCASLGAAVRRWPDTAQDAFTFVVVLAPDAAAAREAVARCKTTYTKAVILCVCRESASLPLPEGDVFTCPFRLGALEARIDWHRRRLERLGGLPSYLPLGSRVLDLQEDRLFDGSGSGGIRLTEKERDILVALYRGGAKGLDRKSLLKRVWRYADGVETHTLETHIYRLRQKIEKDPAEPEIVCTSENGYVLGPLR